MSSPGGTPPPAAPFQLPTELVSGPDVGGGYLLQLTWSRPPASSAFTFHLQPGGTDAAGEAAATPDRLGFRHPSVSCPIGGPRCWERSFRCGAERRSMVRLAYNRFRFALAPLLEQVAGIAVPPVESALEQLLPVASQVLEARGIPWEIGGSAGAWIRGVPLVPGDIDLGTTAEGATVLAEELQDYLIAPLAVTDHLGNSDRLGAEAFLGTLKDGARVEWSGASSDSLETEPFNEWGGPGVWARRQRMTWHQFDVPVAPLEFDLVRAAERQRKDRIELIVDHLRRSSYDRGLLAQALDVSTLLPEARSRLVARLA
ncbi:MAG: hypothetical protein L3K03_07095 [Thermoplasmata archaeon]|nr:hypothetical protein [Thermoplasmata archaeon]